MTTHVRPYFAALAMALALAACATTETTSTSWTPEARAGQVESVQQVTRRTEGNPTGGALAGGAIGGLLTGRWVGAAAGAAVGAYASRGSSESTQYQVQVRFDDGTRETLMYQGPPPFRPGDSVVQTPNGLVPR